jgi:hypothetical protein
MKFAVKGSMIGCAATHSEIRRGGAVGQAHCRWAGVLLCQHGLQMDQVPKGTTGSGVVVGQVQCR